MEMGPFGPGILANAGSIISYTHQSSLEPRKVRGVFKPAFCLAASSSLMNRCWAFVRGVISKNADKPLSWLKVMVEEDWDKLEGDMVHFGDVELLDIEGDSNSVVPDIGVPNKGSRINSQL